MPLGALVKGALSAEAAAGLIEPARRFSDALPGQYPGDPAVADRLATLAGTLQKSQKPVVVCGTDIVRETTPSLAADIALLLKAAGKEAGLFYLLPGANAFGAALVSAPGQPEAADRSPGQWPWGPAAVGEPAGPGEPALSADAILEGIDQGRIKALVLVENDPFWSFYDEARLALALERLEFLLVLDYVPSATVKAGSRGAPHRAGVRADGLRFCQPGGPGASRVAGPWGGTPLALISPDVHPPRTWLDHVPGSDPRTPAEIFQELTRALSGLADPAPVDLWAWLGRQNPIFTPLGSLAEHPEGVRLLPAAPAGGDFAAPPAPPAAPAPDQVELLLVDWTFGTEELASYSPLMREAEAAPVLLIHPDDAGKLGLGDGNRANVHLPKGSLAVTVKLAAALAPGVLVLPRHRQLDWRKLAETPVYLTPNHVNRVQG